MPTIVFDSHTFAKHLRATGFTEEQDEVIVDASRDALSPLVTNEDLKIILSKKYWHACQKCKLNQHFNSLGIRGLE